MKANYIIFHPDFKREEVAVEAISLVDNELKLEWNGNIQVDKRGVGNEDPFVFRNPWVYSYCHASQLRRNERKDNTHLQVGSIIIFVSGQKANKCTLCIDTIFVVGKVQKWGENPLSVPISYQNDKKSQTELWKRHLQFPFNGVHENVSHSYEAELWEEGKDSFSYLPYNKNKESVSLNFSDIADNIRIKIKDKVKGKYPVLLTNVEINEILKLIENQAYIKVVKNIKPLIGNDNIVKNKC